MSLINTFNFGVNPEGAEVDNDPGVNSGDFGAIVGGDAVYNSPEREVEMITIPGRNGQLALDRGRYENIEVTYPAFIGTKDQAVFRQKISDLRNQLAKYKGAYRRLSDSYHPDEFRIASFRNGIEVSPSIYGRVGAFDITFDCKPQRFLLSGDEWVDMSDSAQQAFANAKTISAVTNGDATIDSLSVDITFAKSRDSGALFWDLSSQDGIRIAISDETGAETEYVAEFPVGVRLGEFFPLDGTLRVDRIDYELPTTTYIQKLSTIAEDVFAISGVSTGFKNQEGLYFESNLFERASSADTLHGGYRAWIESDARILFCLPGITTSAAARQFLEGAASDGHPVTLVADAATPPEYTVTPVLSWTPSQADTVTTFKLMDPTGRGVSKRCDMNMTITAPTTLSNPTPFESHPLIEVTGNGTVEFADVTITIDNSDTTEPVFIDCEVMEAWAEVDGQIESRNSIVTMDNNNFPVLPVGASTVYADSGITSLRVKPRWWKL